jgi:hypothetical protein
VIIPGDPNDQAIREAEEAAAGGAPEGDPITWLSPGEYEKLSARYSDDQIREYARARRKNQK